MTTQTNPLYANFLLSVAIESDEIGRRIKAAREKRGWTQLEFASEANVSPSSVQRWEAGRLPPVRELVRLADVLGISADQLVEPASPGIEEELLHELEGLRSDVRRILKHLRMADEARVQRASSASP